MVVYGWFGFGIGAFQAFWAEQGLFQSSFRKIFHDFLETKVLVILLVRPVGEERLGTGGAADTVCLEHVAFRYVFVWLSCRSLLLRVNLLKQTFVSVVNQDDQLYRGLWVLWLKILDVFLVQKSIVIRFLRLF